MEEKIVIIGAGIAGLYAGYKIRKLYPSKSIIILEANGKKDIGGRMGNQLFQGELVVTGAGIGRKRKDKLLIQLLDELKINYNEFLSQHHYAKTLETICNVKTQFNKIKTKYNEERPTNKTFREFAQHVLGKNKYDEFITCAGYTDYEHEDIHDTLYHYGFDDNYEDWVGLSIPWTRLIIELIKKIRLENIHVNTRVERIEESSPKHFLIHTNKKVYSCNKVIVATTVDTVKKLFPGEPIYKDIKGQPFLRIYGKFSRQSIPVIQQYVKGFTIVPGPLQKIIPINPDIGIYMIAYSDNKGAIYLKRFLENTVENRTKLSTIIKKSLSIPKEVEIHLSSILDIYWEIGTHYYKPLDHIKYRSREDFIRKAQHPSDGICVVGEMISTNQGWVEGALESVDNVI
jgi:hypothetical protein